MSRLPSSLLDIDDDDPRAVPISMTLMDAADIYEQRHAEVELSKAPDENKFFAGVLLLLSQLKGR